MITWQEAVLRGDIWSMVALCIFRQTVFTAKSKVWRGSPACRTLYLYFALWANTSVWLLADVLLLWCLELNFTLCVLCGFDSFGAVFFEVWWGSISWFLLATLHLPPSFSFGLFGTCNFYLLYANRFNFLPCLIDIMSIVWLMSQVCSHSVKFYLRLWKYFPFLELHLISIELSPGVLAGHKFDNVVST